MYAVLMPWIEGSTWIEVLGKGRALSRQECDALARGLLDVLSYLEEYGVAHCDVSGANVLLPMLEDEDFGLPPACLVDVEGIYGPDIPRSAKIFAGSPGYAHRSIPEDLWGARADRFSGAVPLCEMLCWCSDHIHQSAWGESYYDPEEIQSTGSSRYAVMCDVLRSEWGGKMSDLFRQAWESEGIEQCPSFVSVLMPSIM